MEFNHIVLYVYSNLLNFFKKSYIHYRKSKYQWLQTYLFSYSQFLKRHKYFYKSESINLLEQTMKIRKVKRLKVTTTSVSQLNKIRS